MVEDDPIKIAELVEMYRTEYLMEREAREEDGKRRRVDESGRMVIQERASGSQQPAVYAEMEVGNVSKGTEDAAKLWSIDLDECLKTLDDHDADEYAWDDVNNMAWPIDLVRKERKEEMRHMKGKIFKVVKKSEAWEVTGKAPISTKCVDTDKTHGTGTPLVRSRWVARDFQNPHEKDREDLFQRNAAD